jgi:hypothetical protein
MHITRGSHRRDIVADHAIVLGVPEDDRAVMERLAALEAEVKADAEKQRARKEVALTKVREERAAKQAESESLRSRQAALVTTKNKPRNDEDELDNLGGALQLAKKANEVKQELAKKGEKSWVKGGLASTLLGPVGWLYAGSFREAIPASAIYILLGMLASKILPMFMLFPVMLVALPLSGIVGAMYALKYNKTGKRQRLFNSKDQKQLAKKT